MRKLSVLLALTLSLSVFSCTNMNGNQENNVNGIAAESTVVPGGDKDGVAPEYLTYDSFREKVWDFEKNPQEWHFEGDVPCVVDFYADWCRPCKMVAPIMDELAVKYDGKIKFYKINVDKEKKLAGVFGINSIPAVLFSPMEGQPSMQAGALPKAQYIEIIEKSLLKNDSSK